jgi:hypothetical protein
MCHIVSVAVGQRFASHEKGIGLHRHFQTCHLLLKSFDVALTFGRFHGQSFSTNGRLYMNLGIGKKTDLIAGQDFRHFALVGCQDPGPVESFHKEL